MYLRTIHYYSWYVEIRYLPHNNSTDIIMYLISIFAFQGVPVAVMSDNGLLFSEEAFSLCRHVISVYALQCQWFLQLDPVLPDSSILSQKINKRMSDIRNYDRCHKDPEKLKFGTSLRFPNLPLRQDNWVGQERWTLPAPSVYQDLLQWKHTNCTMDLLIHLMFLCLLRA